MRTSIHLRRPTTGHLLAAFVVGLAGILGCNAPNARPVEAPPAAAPAPGPLMSALEQGKLRQRALEFVHRAARSDIDVVATNAIEALVQIDPDNSSGHFLAALNSDSPMLRYAGCVAIGQTKQSEALDRVRRCLNDPDPRVQLGAAFAVFRCGDRSTGWVLTEALTKGKDEKLCCIAAELTGRIGEKSAAKVLRGVADNRSTPAAVAVDAVGAMALLGDERAVAKLSQFTLGSSEIRPRVLQWIEELASPLTREALLYCFRLKDEYLVNRLIAARALGRLGVREGYDLAMSTLTKPPPADPEDANMPMRLKQNAARALGEIGDQQALAALKTLAEDESDARVQLAACVAICRIIEPPVGWSRPAARSPSRGEKR